jgi:hypothetical protein
MQTRSSFNVIGPGGTAYFFRRTRGLPEPGTALPPRLPMSTPLDPIGGETGYIMRRSKPIWGQARFDPVRAQWRFLAQEPAPDITRPDPRRTHPPMTANPDGIHNPSMTSP